MINRSASFWYAGVVNVSSAKVCLLLASCPNKDRTRAEKTTQLRKRAIFGFLFRAGITSGGRLLVPGSRNPRIAINLYFVVIQPTAETDLPKSELDAEREIKRRRI